ncbi:MAG: hypothetical protein K1X53_03405 [Candidatus Sumerlaeaceae bacterium]|nr:hypothetical protein [Candidatus Sumerlaeaceae bacterium]
MRRLIVLSLLLSALSAHAAPGLINYQAKLTDSNGLPLNSTVNITFTFWDAATSGTQLGGGFSDTDSVTPANGVCSTNIGDDPSNPVPASVFASDSVWLNVNVGGNDVTPRTRIAASGYALNAVSLFGSAYAITEVTNNAATNGTNLLAAYNRAKALLPHGQALSAQNRATVIVPPGNYDLGTSELLLDTEFVDVIGLSSIRDDQYILGAANDAGTGVLHQTANDVRIENLRVRCTRSSGLVMDNSSDPAAYFPDGGFPQSVIRNCTFEANDTQAWSMRLGAIYAGTYEKCTGGQYAFGGGFSMAGGTASGTFTNCAAGHYSFGKDGTANGVFTNCTAGNSSFGAFGTASGTFTNCTGAVGAFGGYGGTASGTFTNCTADYASFGGYGGAAIGTFTNCTAPYGTFGGNSGTASGTFVNCTGGADSFGGGGGNASGKFQYCSAVSGSFGGGGSTNGAQLVGCRLLGVWSGTFGGRMENCTWGPGITCNANARIYSCTFAGTIDLNNTAAGVTMTRATDITNEGNNVFGGTSAAALNVENANVSVN